MELGKNKQGGISLTGLIFILVIVGGLGVLGLRIVPTYSEFMSVKKAIVQAKASGPSPADIKKSFDNQADISFISSITGKDLQLTRDGNDVEVSFYYQKKIPLVAFASLLLEYEGTTAKVQPPRKVEIK
jgi:hypothetical protein